MTASSWQAMQQDEAVPGACCSCQYVSLVCAEGIEDLTCQEEGTQDSWCLEAGSAADGAYTAGDTVRPALRGDTADLGIAAVGEADGDDNGCSRWSEFQGKAQELLSTPVLM